MGGQLGNTIDLNRMADLHEACAFTSVATWVVRLDLPSQALALYMRLCHLAENEDPNRTRVTLTPDEADRLTGGDGTAALNALLKVGAITRVSRYKSGKTRYEIQDLPPRTQAALGEYRQAGGLPVVSFG